MTALPYLLSVVRSDWDDTLFCAVEGDPRTLIVWHGETLWTAIMDAVAGWEQRVDTEHSFTEYVRPE